MPIYKKADARVENLLDEVIQKYHPHLAESGLTVDILMAYGTSKSPVNPVKHHGYPAHAVIRIVNAKDRAKGMSDCEITIDGEWWKRAPIETKRSVLDHELTHLQTEGEDDEGRLRLSIRRHDFQLGWFTDCVERHGVESIEFQQFNALAWAVKQQWLPFMGESKRAVQQRLDEIETTAKPPAKAKRKKKEGGE